MVVYVLSYSCFDFHYVSGVYLSEDAANEYLDKIDWEDTHQKRGDFHIQMFVVKS